MSGARVYEMNLKSSLQTSQHQNFNMSLIDTTKKENMNLLFPVSLFAARYVSRSSLLIAFHFRAR
jgi:hypothetical protein